MTSKATRRFWESYHRLPEATRRLAVRTYKLWRRNPHHPSLQFKRLHGSDDRFSVRIGLHHRALGRRTEDEVVWVWIGTHAEYDGILRRK